MALNFRPKIPKIVELLLYLAHTRPGADKYQAVKFFYLADREHLRRYGRPITYEQYYALSYGPVASNALDLLNGNTAILKRFGIEALPFKIEIGKAKNGKDTTFIREPLRKFDPDFFSKSDLEVFDEVIAKHGDATFDELFKLTHEHTAYTTAWRGRLPGIERAEMFYDAMIDDEKERAKIIEDLAPIAASMK